MTSQSADALRNMPDDSGMIEHNPEEGMRLFCCGGAVNDGYRGVAGVGHTAECWYVGVRAALEARVPTPETPSGSQAGEVEQWQFRAYAGGDWLNTDEKHARKLAELNHPPSDLRALYTTPTPADSGARQAVNVREKVQGWHDALPKGDDYRFARLAYQQVLGALAEPMPADVSRS